MAENKCKKERMRIFAITYEVKQVAQTVEYAGTAMVQAETLKKAQDCFKSESQFNGVQDKLRIKNIVEVNFTKGTKLLAENFIKTDSYEQSKF
jgi:urease gamma subunit